MCTAFTLEQCWASAWLQDSFDRCNLINEGRRRGWKERQSLRGEGVTMQVRQVLDLGYEMKPVWRTTTGDKMGHQEMRVHEEGQTQSGLKFIETAY